MRRGKIIVAMTVDGVIGLDNKVPWHYSADLRRFKRLTMNTTVIMGRNTWESLPVKPLPGRQNIVITRSTKLEVEHYGSLDEALNHADNETVWFIGGAQLYRTALEHCELLDVTYIPDQINAANSIRFPSIDWTQWEAGPKIKYEDDQRLYRQQFRFRKG